MQRKDMTCVNCVKIDGDSCRLQPKPIPIDNPEAHWCAQGQWRKWSERFQEMEPYYWGEWE